LNEVTLENNLCINKNFGKDHANSIETLPQSIPLTCFLKDPVKFEVKDIKFEDSRKSEIESWKAEAEAWQEENKKTHNLINLIKENFEKINEKQSKMFEQQIDRLSDLLRIKTEEIDWLKIELEKEKKRNKKIEL
jgi:hypothetical protein